MATARHRQENALRALDALLAGARAADLESDILDFKEEQGTVGAGGQRIAIEPRTDSAAQALAGEAACMANSDRGGVIVVGVDDKGVGSRAVRGAYLDGNWLRRRIHQWTVPPLQVDEIEERIVEGKRVYLIDVAPALAEIWCNGRLRRRQGDACVEVTGDDARRFLEARRRYDWSAEPSEVRLSDVDPAAYRAAAAEFEGAHGRRPGSVADLCLRLGLYANGAQEDDPLLNRAGALLLTAADGAQVHVDVLLKTGPSGPSVQRREFRAPLIQGLLSVEQHVLAALPVRPLPVGLQRLSIRTIPEPALREALVNAAMHRDYRQPRSRVVIEVMDGRILQVRSPGGFVEGVRADRLLSVPSRPRNEVLAQAFRGLRMAEREGAGIDALYIQMIRLGHAEPSITEEDGDVLCVLRGGPAHEPTLRFFVDLEHRTPAMIDDVRPYLAVASWLREPVLRPEHLARAAQCSIEAAEETLARLLDVGVAVRLANGGRSFRLANAARAQLHDRIVYKTRSSLDEQWDTVRAYLDGAETIDRTTAEVLLQVSSVRASQVLGALRDEGKLVPVGNPRGRSVRYRPASP